MEHDKSIADAGAYRSDQPIIRSIGITDLRDALAGGYADFLAVPTHLVFLCLIYPVVTLVIIKAAADYEVLSLVFPLLSGYTLIGPFVAIGLYELSRRRELGLETSRRHAFNVLQSPSIFAIVMLVIYLSVIYLAWLFAAQAIYEQIFGSGVPSTIEQFAHEVLDTPSGWELIIVGSCVGFLFAAVVFAQSVVSFPMLLDRDVGVIKAIETSVRVVVANPLTMAVWGLIVAGLLLIGSLPLFIGLAVVLPVLGHATWHLYRKVVEY
jgi:uncharacterized membrane protein